MQGGYIESVSRFKFVLLIALSLACTSPALSQGKIYAGPDDPAGDIAAEREGYMTGNRVFLYFRNTTELSDWPKSNVSRWPNNLNGVKMVDGIGLLVGAKVYIKDDPNTDLDSIPLTDPLEIATTPYHTLYYLQTSYREEMDTDPTGTVEWGFYPVFGYFNELGEYPAMSNLPQSWPPVGWPAADYQTKWPNEWNGRFGRGVIYADLETFMVVNDAQDQENLGVWTQVQYYPRPGHKIGDLRPNVTIQKGNPWGGLGIRVEARGFQWNNPQARDALFWEYTIANISEYDLPEVAFGYWVDNAIGDDGSDELGYFDATLDLAYSWDTNGVGAGGLSTGTMGFAYLESPGLPYDHQDNDNDGLRDEKRDNVATTLIGPTDGIDNLTAFLNFYHLTIDDLREHWDADEDGDWEDGEDLNNDGVYQLSEYAGDDVGLDGVGPGELNYTGPDEGECNHRPDYIEGLGCEPNFAATDVSESDMVGLTSFQLFPVDDIHPAPPGTKWFRNDDVMWGLVGADTLEEYSGNISNLIEVFASGPFPLYQGRTERISMAELHSYDPLEGLNDASHAAPSLYENKRIVQVIYEKDYRFAQPPKMPTLTATPGDGEVVLTWDDIADTRTRDPFVGNVNDFEGYKVYRATDKYMSDPEVITDGYGTPIFKKPIYQCDLKDGKQGFTDFGLINGVGYNLGYESGINHIFVDHNVENGRTYYYAVVAYDYGAPDIGPGIAPSENNVVIELNEAENVRGIGKNVVIVVPHQIAPGYVPPNIEEDSNDHVIGTGNVNLNIMANGALKDGHTYSVTFRLDTLAEINNYDHGVLYTNDGMTIYDITDSNMVEVYSESPTKYTGSNLVYNDSLDYWAFSTSGNLNSDVFDGLRVEFSLHFTFASVNWSKSGWLQGSGLMHMAPSSVESMMMPWDYDIIFTGDSTAYTGRVVSKTNIRDEANRRITPTSKLLTGLNWDFYVVNKLFTDSTGSFEKMDLIGYDQDANGVFDRFTDKVLVGAVNTEGRWAGTVAVLDFIGGNNTIYPEPNDTYHLTFNRPFWLTDSLKYTVHVQDSLDQQAISSNLDKIRVVPNPYVATNAMEPAVANPFLNQRRRIMFTNIPAACTIKIFTVSGVLVDEINVDNPPDVGIIHWDLQSREGLEIAAGMYLYHVKINATGETKTGKFAVIK